MRDGSDDLRVKVCDGTDEAHARVLCRVAHDDPCIVSGPAEPSARTSCRWLGRRRNDVLGICALDAHRAAGGGQRERGRRWWSEGKTWAGVRAGESGGRNQRSGWGTDSGCVWHCPAGNGEVVLVLLVTRAPRALPIRSDGAVICALPPPFSPHGPIAGLRERARASTVVVVKNNASTPPALPTTP